MTLRPLTENDLPRLMELYQHLSSDNTAMDPEKVRGVFTRDSRPFRLIQNGLLDCGFSSQQSQNFNTLIKTGHIPKLPMR